MYKLAGSITGLVLILIVFTVNAQSGTNGSAIDLLNQGKRSLQMSRYQDALASFKAASQQLSPYQAEASFWIIKAQLALNRLDDAQLTLEAFLKQYPTNNNVAEAYYLRARILYLQSDINSATKAFADFLERYPKSPWTANAYYWIGESLLAAGQLDEARKMFTIVLKDYPTSYKVEAAYYKQSLIDQKSREEQLLSLLTAGNQENLKNIEAFNRKEQAYQEAIREYQKKLTNAAPQAFQDQLRDQAQQLAVMQSESAAEKQRIAQLNAQVRDLQVALQKAQTDLQKTKDLLRSSPNQMAEALEKRSQLLDAKEAALKLKEQALLNLEQDKK